MNALPVGAMLKISKLSLAYPGCVVAHDFSAKPANGLVLVRGGGGRGKPVPISENEAGRILRQVQEGVKRPKPAVSFEIGEQVKVADGPFASFNGTVEDVDEERARLKVAVSIFGRSTPVELDYAQVEKI